MNNLGHIITGLAIFKRGAGLQSPTWTCSVTKQIICIQ